MASSTGVFAGLKSFPTAASLAQHQAGIKAYLNDFMSRRDTLDLDIDLGLTPTTAIDSEVPDEVVEGSPKRMAVGATG